MVNIPYFRLVNYYNLPIIWLCPKIWLAMAFRNPVVNHMFLKYVPATGTYKMIIWRYTPFLDTPIREGCCMGVSAFLFNASCWSRRKRSSKTAFDGDYLALKIKSNQRK